MTSVPAPSPSLDVAPPQSSRARELVPYVAGVVAYLAVCIALSWWLRDTSAATLTASPAPSSPASSLRPSPDTFPWTVVGELALVVYAYSSFARRSEHREVFLGLAFWAGELVWEMVNGLIGHLWGHPLFGVRGQTAWHLYAGLNIEISLMFAVAPLVLFGILPKTKVTVLGRISNRTLVACGLGLFCVFVEVLLHRAGALVWQWWFWKWPHVGVVAFAYCAPFVLLAWVHERVTKVRDCQKLLGLAAGAAVLSHLVIHVLLAVPLPG